jgi:hypothetical protein
MIGLAYDDALGQWATVPRLNIKLNALAFDEGLATFSLNLRVVNKDVGLAFDCDEAPTFLVVEPLNGSYSHCGPPCCLGTNVRRFQRNHHGNLKK